MNFCNLGLAVIETEAQAVFELSKRIDARFEAACQLLLACKGRVVVTGMGKSGHIAHKIAATFSSTGTPAFFMHPGEASHGDLGMITPDDIVVAISHSGHTQELIVLLPLLKRLDVPLITLTGNLTSTLATSASVNLDISIQQEALVTRAAKRGIAAEFAPLAATVRRQLEREAVTGRRCRR